MVRYMLEVGKQASLSSLSIMQSVLHHWICPPVFGELIHMNSILKDITQAFKPLNFEDVLSDVEHDTSIMSPGMGIEEQIPYFNAGRISDLEPALSTVEHW